MRALKLIACTLALAVTAAAQTATPKSGATKPATAKSTQKPAAAAKTPATPAKNPTAVIHTGEGDLTCELYKDKVPGAVDNFVGLAMGTKDWTNPDTGQKNHAKPLYDGTIFHRVIPSFMIQGGDPLGSGMGNAGFRIPDEYSPDLKFDKPGVLAYANSGPNTNSSQFFVTEVPYPSLDPCLDEQGCMRGSRQVPKGYGYTIFGQCTPESVELVKKIAREQTGANNRPDNPVVIKHIEIQGVSAPKPAAKKPVTKRPGTAAKSTNTTAKPKSSTTPPKQ